MLEPDGPASYKFEFATTRGAISGSVPLGLGGPPDNHSEADEGRPMSANGTLQTLMLTLSMSALGGKADIVELRSGSASDPKRTFSRPPITLRNRDARRGWLLEDTDEPPYPSARCR